MDNGIVCWHNFAYSMAKLCQRIGKVVPIKWHTIMYCPSHNPYVLLLVGRQCPFAVADSIIGAAAGVVDDTAGEEALLPGGEVFQDSEETSGVSHLLVGTEIGTSVGRSG